ncbi:MAG: hypothetical protein ABW328_07920 [Ilumatobacteraceae bacterium]
MRKNWLLATGVGVLAAAALLVVGIGAYNAGRDDGRTVEVVTSAGEPGRTLVVPVDAWRGGYGGWRGGPGFLLVPLIILGVVLLVGARRRGGWAGPGRYRGAGPYVPCRPDDDPALEDWHRRAHAGVPVDPAVPPSTVPPSTQPTEPGRSDPSSGPTPGP